jgi:hypothetical protein
MKRRYAAMNAISANAPTKVNKAPERGGSRLTAAGGAKEERNRTLPTLSPSRFRPDVSARTANCALQLTDLILMQVLLTVGLSWTEAVAVEPPSFHIP